MTKLREYSELITTEQYQIMHFRKKFRKINVNKMILSITTIDTNRSGFEIFIQ